MPKGKDNLIEIPFTREMMVKKCLENALNSIGDMDSIVVLARDKEGDTLMFHSFDNRAELIDIMEETKFAIFSGDFFDA